MRELEIALPNLEGVAAMWVFFNQRGDNPGLRPATPFEELGAMISDLGEAGDINDSSSENTLVHIEVYPKVDLSALRALCKANGWGCKWWKA